MELADSRSRAPSSWRKAVASGKGELGEVALAAFGEDEPELGESSVEDTEEGLGHDPLFWRILCWWEGAKITDGAEKIVAMVELFDEGLEMGLVGFWPDRTLRRSRRRPCASFAWRA